ncbi:MAG: peptide chain release factor-like protein [Elusimicrobiota bacterium]
MDLNERFAVSEGKIRDLRARIERVGLDLAAVQETFVRGGGKGGQKINKTANCVQLRYPPLGLTIRCQKDRRRSVNRFLALRELVERIETRAAPATSTRVKETERVRKRKARRRGRSRRKYGTSGPEAPDQPEGGAG